MVEAPKIINLAFRALSDEEPSEDEAKDVDVEDGGSDAAGDDFEEEELGGKSAE